MALLITLSGPRGRVLGHRNSSSFSSEFRPPLPVLKVLPPRQAPRIFVEPLVDIVLRFLQKFRSGDEEAGVVVDPSLQHHVDSEERQTCDAIRQLITMGQVDLVEERGLVSIT